MACNKSVLLEALTVADFKTYFDRAFPYGPLITDVRDSDIEKAFKEACAVFNASIYVVEPAPTTILEQPQVIAFLYLTAHYLVQDISMGQQGLSSAGQFIVSSKSVGSVSIAYGVPEKFLNDPNFAYFITTKFGLKYLSLTTPALVGNVSVVKGCTTP